MAGEDKAPKIGYMKITFKEGGSANTRPVTKDQWAVVVGTLADKDGIFTYHHESGDVYRTVRSKSVSHFELHIHEGVEL